MAEIQAIQTLEDYDRALVRLWAVFDAKPGTPESDECDALAALVAAYDDLHYPIPDPSPSDLIQGRLDALGLTEEDLIPGIGSREKVDQVLTGQREITPEMAAALHQLLGIAVADLLPAGCSPTTTKPAVTGLEQRLFNAATGVRGEERV